MDSCTGLVQAIAPLGKCLRVRRKTALRRHGFFDIRRAGKDIRRGAERMRRAGSDIRRSDKHIRLPGGRIRRRFHDGRRSA
jgi:hypothetical protein